MYFILISGLKYERENEEDMKDKLDFQAPPPEHYPPGGKCVSRGRGY